MAPLYPPFPTLNSGYLRVSSIHTIYWEECGLLRGIPVIYFHGGPGGGISEDDRRYFDPSHYRIILFDQRGAGKSIPHASLEDNTTWDLIEDVEALRKFLQISRWIVFGGSWGSTLSLAYAEKYPDRCLGLILRGIFTMRKEELNWFFQKGASMLFPDFFNDYQAVIPVEERGHMIQAYYKRLTGNNEEERMKCASAWGKWEAATGQLMIDPNSIKKTENSKWILSFASIEIHYFFHDGWLNDGQLIEEAQKIKHLPIIIIQGRYDVLCPVRTSWDLYMALGGSSNKNIEYKIVSDSGHSASEPGIQSALVDATEKFKSLSHVIQDNSISKS
ncbi:Proline iminopeptidase [Erysiphe neolycopersici]|uniref:Proline iminopeptidase n=1 Tax=Erysiphe neolycopersici TaxID=212602 RepID=A0A420I6U0_9PEZI|nr:Proline iminopeptidase [Erysiphe neolycopersici]